MGFLVGAAEEEIGVEALADEPTLHVRETSDHRIDIAGGCGLLQFF